MGFEYCKKIRLLLYWLILLGFTGCDYSNKNRYINNDIQNKWIGNQIILIDTLFCINNNLYDQNAKYKIVVSIDALCIPCKESLLYWNLYLKELPLKKIIQPVFFINAGNKIELQKEFIGMDFCYPTFIDKNDIFYKINKISENPYYQAMIIDSKNKILFIGNPICDNELREQFQRTIMEILKNDQIVD
jgi:hypothetical protein